MPPSPPSNSQIAALFDLIADHLSAKDENPFRVRSYRTAAVSVRSSKTPIGKIVEENGGPALKGIPGVGERLAGLIEEYVKSGKVELLESLRKEVTPEDLEKVQAAKKEHPAAAPGAPLIPLSLILGIDAEYREKAGARKLKLIAPKLLNPEKKAWLPILATNLSRQTTGSLSITKAGRGRTNVRS
jgi:DNA polymerase/3'-5' exonuclease PolX